MRECEVTKYIEKYYKYFPEGKLYKLREALLETGEENFQLILAINLRKPLKFFPKNKENNYINVICMCNYKKYASFEKKT